MGAVIARTDPLSVAGDLPEGVVIAVDAGGSKIDAVAVDMQGAVVAHQRGPGSNPQVDGISVTLRSLEMVITRLRERLSGEVVLSVSLYLSGIDVQSEREAMQAALADQLWSRDDAGRAALVENDTFALLRTGASEHDAVAVVCGTGMNAVGVRSDGAVTRFASFGRLSGDWGGGGDLGPQVFWHAARAADGRGPETLLHALVCEHFEVAKIEDVMERIHLGEVSSRSLVHLTPLLFDAAEQGDPIALADVHRQAEEIVVMAIVCLGRLEMHERTVTIVLGGGIIGARRPVLIDAVALMLREQAPHARVRIETAPPVIGAALEALESQGMSDSVLLHAEHELRAQYEQLGAQEYVPKAVL